MKKVTEKDLSLDEQVVSNISKASDTRDETDNNCNASEDFQCQTNEDACEASYNANTCRCTLQQNCETLGCHYTKSQQILCCDETAVDECTLLSDACVSVGACPATDDTQCGICSNTPGCMIPIPETKRC